MERMIIIDYFGLRKEIYVTVSDDFRNIPREFRYRLLPSLPKSPSYNQTPTQESIVVKDITFYFEGEMEDSQFGNCRRIPVYRAKEF